MYAYRIYDEKRGIWFQDNDDDGESAAGSRMLHLVVVASLCELDVHDGREERHGGGVAVVGRHSPRTRSLQAHQQRHAKRSREVWIR